MTPRIGPKYSVRWYSLPRCTPARTPGLQSLPSSSSLVGSITHDSPAPSVVRPSSSLPSAGAMTGPICAVGSHGMPTVSERTPSTSWLCMRRERPACPTRIASDAAEHFWPAWPKALATMSFAARS